MRWEVKSAACNGRTARWMSRATALRPWLSVLGGVKRTRRDARRRPSLRSALGSSVPRSRIKSESAVAYS
jgi:hypothetical protein